METTMDKKLRKRMIFMEFERNRRLNARCSSFPYSPKSFGKIKEEREAAAVSNSGFHDCSYDERDDNCNISIVSDCVTEMRRRRVYEMHHNRPFPVTANRKKHKFWEPEEVPGPPVMLCSSFSASTSDKMRRKASPSSNHSNENLEYSSKIATPRVLWKVQTTNLQHDFEALVLNNSDPELERKNEIFTNDEIMDYAEEDEIMTPIRIKKPINTITKGFNDDTQTGPPLVTTTAPTRISNEATVAEIQTATQALAAFVTKAAYVMEEAKRPCDTEELEPSKFITRKRGSIEKSVSFTPDLKARSKEFYEPATYRVHPEATPLKSLSNEAYSSTICTKQKGLTSTPSYRPTITTPMTMDNSMDEADIMISNRDVSIDVDVDDDDHVVGAVNGVVVASLESDVLWMSLFGDNFVGIDDNAKAMLEALVNGGALKREANEINSLKVFVDMYHKHTFEQIVQSIKFLKGLQSLVICRGLDQTRPTYRSVQEIKSLLDATGSIEQLDSLMLLNFTSDSLTNLAIVIHQQPSIYRLQIQLVEGTLNGEILGVMATAPRLTFVMLELKESCSLGMLMNSKSIQSLRVNSNNLVLKKNHVQTLVCSLQSNFTLTSLDLAPSISIEIFRSLCTTLKQNYRLESLRVNLDLKTVDESGIAALELANLFRENNMLINVWNYSYQVCPVSDTSKRVVISALRNNKSMVNFKFFSEDIDDWKYNMNEDPKTVRLKSDTSVSLLSGADNSIATKSLLEDELSEFADMIDSSTFPIPCDCVTMRNIGNDYYNWACATTKNVQRMEV
mmetsp:Transcript_32282/g.36147  ORF Transcript_32282/g.36147 Transcript_32282/m.36147 type:complete len:791 (-) Transcript_32282:310-2682(-)